MGKRVLVVDDDPGIQETLEGLLEMEGYDTIIAADGIEALDKLDKFTPALIILDIMMPRMNGYEVAAQLRHRGLHPGIPILVLTADSRAGQRASEIGAEGFLEKPFDLDMFLDEVSRLIGT